MAQLDSIGKNILAQIADLHETPMGAYNLRLDGELAERKSTANIDIVTKSDKPGIDIHIKAGTKKESVHIPVVLTRSGLSDMVYNDFYIGAGADVEIVAGCGIHNSGCDTSQHEGIHSFYVGEGARVRYVEKHYGEGEGTGERILNPKTNVYLEKDAFIELETVQIRGVDSTKRYTMVELGEGAEALITEKLLTHGSQYAESDMEVFLNGEGARARVVSRSVAQDRSSQVFYPRIYGNAECFGHVQCDAIIMDGAKVRAIPEISANHVDAQLIHEAAIGKIAGEQILKLMTLGLSEQEAEERILSGFLK